MRNLFIHIYSRKSNKNGKFTLDELFFDLYSKYMVFEDKQSKINVKLRMLSKIYQDGLEARSSIYRKHANILAPESFFEVLPFILFDIIMCIEILILGNNLCIFYYKIFEIIKVYKPSEKQ